jgi:hypothetical protein
MTVGGNPWASSHRQRTPKVSHTFTSCHLTINLVIPRKTKQTQNLVISKFPWHTQPLLNYGVFGTTLLRLWNIVFFSSLRTALLVELKLFSWRENFLFDTRSFSIWRLHLIFFFLFLTPFIFFHSYLTPLSRVLSCRRKKHFSPVFFSHDVCWLLLHFLAFICNFQLLCFPFFLIASLTTGNCHD